MHEIPQEISDFGLLVHGGLTRGKALFYNFLSALSVIASGLLAYWAGSYLEPYLPEGLALVAGAFIYLAAVDLFPELHESSNISHTFAQLFFILVLYLPLEPLTQSHESFLCFLPKRLRPGIDAK